MKQFAIALDAAAKIDLLETSTWVSELNAQQISVLAGYFQPYSIPENIYILEEGASNNFCCLICAGNVDVIKINAGNERKSIQTLGKGKTFGEMSFFDRGPCSASIVTKNRVTILAIEKRHFNLLCQKSPIIALQLMCNLMISFSQRLRQTTGQLVDMF